MLHIVCYIPVVKQLYRLPGKAMKSLMLCLVSMGRYICVKIMYKIPIYKYELSIYIYAFWIYKHSNELEIRQ